MFFIFFIFIQAIDIQLITAEDMRHWEQVHRGKMQGMFKFIIKFVAGNLDKY